ncbi:hypothetical protein CLPU_4c00130 [Gottschalkia purinilytica]|uniref:Uncharacterized protein n=1 Tax=Gottschalkia purinilytica TaxID=1503 RepID=A0A0L0WBX2_GOTPU|nr:hypothetical protein [Gottschalkia purinilytica]KNF08967.1 hypothetical protein CLPU_4c00130 [Gottschalkia purinilytica]
MAKVIRELEFGKKSEALDFLKKEFSLSLSEDDAIINNNNFSYPKKELNTVLVDLAITEKENKAVLTISKLVSLKAFLLAKEEGMNVVELIGKIDRTMKLSSNGVKITKLGIVHNKDFEDFLHSTKIILEESSNDSITLYDGKRQAIVKRIEIDDTAGNELIETIYDFNEITEIN